MKFFRASLKAWSESISLRLSGTNFHIFGPRHRKDSSPKVTVLTFAVRKFDFWEFEILISFSISTFEHISKPSFGNGHSFDRYNHAYIPEESERID